MRKLLNILMAVYIMFAACYPCNDADTCADEKNTSVVAVSAAGHEHSSDEQDLCSPLCFCSCCSSTIHQPLSYTFDFFFPKVKEVNTALRPESVKSVPHTIWQPPKLS